MALLSDLFTIKNGISSSKVIIHPIKMSEDFIPYIGASGDYKNVINGFVDSNFIPSKYIFNKETIFVSTNGAGACTAFVSNFKFCVNSDAVALIPKKHMSINEKMYYALCITKNKYKFSYGRKPKGERLKDVLLPDIVPNVFSNYKHTKTNNIEEKVDKKSNFDLKEKRWLEFDFTDIFNVIIGKSTDLNKLEEDQNGVNYVGRTNVNNGVTAKVKVNTNCTVYKGPCITVPMVGNSTLKSTYQEKPFVVSQNVAILKLNDKKINNFIATFLIVLLNKETFRFSYGRTLSLERLKNLKIKLPVNTLDSPDWDFIESYMKTIRFSKNL